MKVKHIQAEGKQVNQEYKRGRGRPKKNGYYDQCSGVIGLGRIDPTGELFMKTDQRAGGPTDPLHSFEENANLLFVSQGKFQDYTQHPMFVYMNQYSFKCTPQGLSDEATTHQTNGSSQVKKNFKDVSKEIHNTPETKKNLMSCEQIFSLYLRDYSQIVNDQYYSTLMKFVLMFRECLNQFGWHKKAEGEEKENYGKQDYEQRIAERLTSYETLKSCNEFTAVNNAEFAPEIANEFVTIYMDEEQNNRGKLERSEIFESKMDFYNQKGSDSNINQLLYSNDAERETNQDNNNDTSQQQKGARPPSASANATKMYDIQQLQTYFRAQLQKIREQQKQQYENKKKRIFGEGGRGGQEDDRFSLDKMNLDRKDHGDYDPFLKNNKLDLELQAQLNFMNKDSTQGNKFWTPEYQQKMEELKKQGVDLDSIQELPDNIRYYNPNQMGFTEAQMPQPKQSKQPQSDPQNQNDDQVERQNTYGLQSQPLDMAQRYPKHSTKKGKQNDLDSEGTPMNVVGIQDGRTRSKKRKGEVEVLDDGEDDLNAEQAVGGTSNMQFETNMVEDVNGQGKKKKKKKKVKSKNNQDEYGQEDQDENEYANLQQKQKQMEKEDELKRQEQRKQQLEREQKEQEEQKKQLKEMKKREQEMQKEHDRLEKLKKKQQKEDDEKNELEKKNSLKKQVEELKAQQENDKLLKSQQDQQQQKQLQEQQEQDQRNKSEMDKLLKQQQPGIPSYYQQGIIPQQEVKGDAREQFIAFINKLTDPETSIGELRELFVRPVPPNIGQIQCTIVRHKGGFNRLWPKYTLYLSDGHKFLLTGKKRSGNTTSNYMISIEQDKVKKGSQGYLGKLRSNFLGTEFYIYDGGINPKKAKSYQNVRAQFGVVEYEKNVLGSKGPRRMKVLLPKVYKDGSSVEWKSTDKNYTIESIFRAGGNDNVMFFFNKPPKWNDQVQAFVLNFNGRVDKASVKNFQLIDEFDDNKIYMQFGRIGKDQFNLDVAFPFGLFQAFGIALSSFDFKFACE